VLKLKGYKKNLYLEQFISKPLMSVKAIIPVAGKGLRLRPLTYTQPKPLIPVAGKPIISFIIDQLVDAGVEDFVFVIGYLGEKIKLYIQEHYPDLKVSFVKQEERLGSAHAIWMAKEEFVDSDEVIIFFGDAIIDTKLKEVVANPFSSLGVKKVDDPRNFGVVEYGKSGKIKALQEKPRIPRSNMAMVGIYKIKEIKAFIEALDNTVSVGLSQEKEIPLTDALAYMVDKGVAIKTFEVDNWFDCGQMDVLLETNATFLDREGYASYDLPPFYNSIIIHPVSIGQNCDINNSIIGPHVTIGNNVNVQNAIIKNSIIGEYASIKEIFLQKSVVGNDASITGFRHSLNVGDNTEIDFSPTF
jgi:glucose-1-phosphate thymidylyltransferase